MPGTYISPAESGLYYLNSRYYDVEVGRFINSDTIAVVEASTTPIADKNLFAYCDNNPVVREDVTGYVWETAIDVVTLGLSIADVALNPADPWAWINLAADTVDLIPVVTGVGEVTRAIRVADTAIDVTTDTIYVTKAVDFTDEATEVIKTLDRSSGFTKSTMSAGRKIHDGYKATKGFNIDWKEFSRIKGIRPDYVDFNTKTIYELKPMNLKSIKSGVKQLKKYNDALGGGFSMILELY